MRTSLKNILPDYVIDCIVQFKTYFLKVLRKRYYECNMIEKKMTRNKLADWLANA